MKLTDALIEGSIKNRFLVVFLTICFVAYGFFTLYHLKLDAFPDLTNVQVQVLTASPGMPSTEIEQLVTFPLERALSGMPDLKETRSLSRTGISAITVIFEDGTDLWRARQLVQSRLDLVKTEIPPQAGIPELGPPSTGLGEVFQFTLHSHDRSLPELYRIFERDLAPRIRTISGVVEVNAWGGGSPQIDVLLDPYELANRHLKIEQVQQAIEKSVGRVSGGAMIKNAEQILIRGLANPITPEQVAEIRIYDEDFQCDQGNLDPNSRQGIQKSNVINTENCQNAQLGLQQRVHRLGDLGIIKESGALTVGLGSTKGQGDALFVMVQALVGVDALRLVDEIKHRLPKILDTLPKDVEFELVYSRDKLIHNTLSTVKKSLLEGGLLVIFILFIFLGDVRAGLIVSSVIPLSLLGAFIALYLLGYSGNLMSLGAIDFGMVVDGSIVITESIIAIEIIKSLDLKTAIIDKAKSVAASMGYGEAILTLVYFPILALPGVEGKLFRPMAITVLAALFTSLVLSFTYIPALSSWFIKPLGNHETSLMKLIRWVYEPILRFALSFPKLMISVVLTCFVMCGVLISSLGLEFIPRLEEGDLVVQATRLPSLNPQQALVGSSQIEKLLEAFPEVISVATRSGSPAVATDPMGLEQSDILVRLKPRDQWTTTQSHETLVSMIAHKLETEAPDAQYNFSQPIEMRFNEMLEGIKGDVGIKVYGPDLNVLLEHAHKIADVISKIDGVGDVVKPAIEGVPTWEIKFNYQALSLYGLTASDILPWIESVQRGLIGGEVIRERMRENIVIKVDLNQLGQLKNLPIPLNNGNTLPLGELATIEQIWAPTSVDRHQGSRRMVVECNVRGRDIGSFVQEAQEKIGQLALPNGYWIEWSGKYEQLQDATKSIGILLPVVFAMIILLLFIAFRRWKPTILIFLNVPVALFGGLLILWWRDMPLSISAMIGCIALFGVAVMNGIVMLSRTQELHHHHSGFEAAYLSAQERLRPVLTTALVAGLGFVPMAIAHGVGAEVQRPLATVVIGGLLTSTTLTLLILPSLYAWIYRKNIEPLI